MKSVLFAAAAVAAATVAVQAHAQVIADSSGQYAAGIGSNGELYDAGSGVGFVRFIDGFDPLSPGTPRDSWSLATSLSVAYADGQYFGVQGLTTSVVAGANTATATSLTDSGFSVTQAYSFVGDGNILRIDTTVTNLSDYTQHALFGRDVDWDVAPTSLSENTVGPFGTNPFVIDASYLGFEDPSADVPYAFSCSGGCNELGDVGAGIKLDLGWFGVGSYSTFTYYYGLSGLGSNLDALVSQGQAAGATYILGTQSSEADPYPALGANAAILGVGNVVHVGAVPEPATWGLMLAGFFGLGAALRRRRAAAA